VQVTRGTRIDIFMLPGKLPKSAEKYIKKLLLKIPTKNHRRRDMWAETKTARVQNRTPCNDKYAHTLYSYTQLVIYYAYLY